MAAISSPYRDAFECAADPAWLLDVASDGQRRFVDLNRAAEALLGLKRETLAGRQVDDVVALVPRFAALFLRSADVTEASSDEIALDLPDGPQIYSATLTPVRERTSGRIVCIVGVARDITDHKRAEERLLASERQLRALANRRESDLEEERHRIARELHDELGQQLVALRMNVNMLHMQFAEGETRMREVADNMLTLVDTLIQSTRDVSASLRPTILDMGLIPALEWLTSRFTRHTGIRCQLQVDQGEIDMTQEQAVAIFRITQESLTNAATHSKATRIHVAFRRAPNALVIEVKDNGTGFDVQNVRKPNAFGLVGMRERAMAAGGEAVITSTPRRGTIVRARLPLKRGQTRS